jgi:phage terminase large subunit GpA-like protein
MSAIIEIFEDIINETKIFVSDIKPSKWYESNMIMPRGSAFPGPFSFDLTPYWKEPLDCAHKDHPAKEISIMKGAQLGGTAAVLNPVVGYTIAQNPGNIMFLTGHSDLSDAAIQKVDHMIDSCGIRKLIRPSVLRARNSRTGDTNKSKEFPGGNLKSGSVTNHNLLRQHDVMIMIVDDYDASPQFSKDAGSTRELVQKRTSAFAHKKKIFWVSSPQLKSLSNIEEVFLLGDQRYYHVPCPCCHELIILKWSVEAENSGEMAGITWKLDAHNNLIKESVGYVCQKCGGFFDSTNKYDMNINGVWVPTEANPKEKYHQSYQISSLYAPPGMDDWDYYVTQYINANPIGGKRDEKKHQTFMNVVLGETYEYQGEEIKATELQKNIMPYEVGTIPEKLSMEHGNGRIVLITCAADLNGLEDDARLDYEIVAWAENMSSYSISHGSIGTFIPREGRNKKDRERWTYKHGVVNSVWGEFTKILEQIFITDTGRKMKIFISGVDCGYQTQLVYQYIDNCNLNCIGLKGKDEDKFTAIDKDSKTYRHAREKTNLYLVEANIVKDELSRYLGLKYDERFHDSQPNCFINFPTPSGGKYLFDNYFTHFESEHKILDKDARFRWKKKSDVHQNHLWDCHLYNMVCKDILVDIVCKEMGVKNGSFADYVAAVLPK